MMTPTHLLIAGAAFLRTGKPVCNLSVMAGALLPDLSIYWLYTLERFFANTPAHKIWSTLYWQEPWQTLSAISNSIPLYLTVLLIGFVAGWRWLGLLAAAALLHVAFDLPFHHSDAHQHFWPLSDLRYHAPLSYWDPAHYGSYVAVVEIGLALGCIVLIWRRFETWWVKGLLGLGLVSYLAVPLYFHLTLG